MAHADIGVIGGSGLYEMDGLSGAQDVDLDTPFGRPSDTIVVGRIEGVDVAFLPRHGRGHRLLPSEVPSQANIYALKSLGVEQVISASAVGSLQEHLHPMDMVIPDQVVDRTTRRPSTFFGAGIVAHISFAHPFCARLSTALADVARSVVPATHSGGTYLCMEGPAFSTLAESVTYRHLGFDVIGMTALPEAKLAREAGMCYAVLAQVTDYDCWHPDHETVTGEMVMRNVARNVANARAIVREVLPTMGTGENCECRHALEGAIMTAASSIDPSALERLSILLPRDIFAVS